MKTDSNDAVRLTVLIVLAGVFVSTVWLLAGRIAKAQTDYHTLQRNLENYQQEIATVKKINKKKLDRELSTLQKRFPSPDNVPLVIIEITDIAKKYEVKVNTITPSGQVERSKDTNGFDNLSTMKIEMDLEGTYPNLSAFLSDLANLEDGVIKTKHFKLSPAKRNDTLFLHLEAALFVRTTEELQINDEKLPQTDNQRIPTTSRFGDFSRDPFHDIRNEPLPFNLEGIIYDPAQPMALIGGEMREVGDQIDGILILSIQPDHILVQRGKDQIEVRVASSS